MRLCRQASEWQAQWISFFKFIEPEQPWKFKPLKAPAHSNVQDSWEMARWSMKGSRYLAESQAKLLWYWRSIMASTWWQGNSRHIPAVLQDRRVGHIQTLWYVTTAHSWSGLFIHTFEPWTCTGIYHQWLLLSNILHHISLAPHQGFLHCSASVWHRALYSIGH